jgi:hypothetical protein
MMTTNIECLLCHAVHAETFDGHAVRAWRCGRCGQHWDAARVATVLDYQRWVKSEAATIGHTAAGQSPPPQLR